MNMLKKGIMLITTAIMTANISGCNIRQKNSNVYKYIDKDGVNGIFPNMQFKKKVTTEYDSYLNDLSRLPFSFTYGEKKYKGFGKEFNENSRETITEGNKVSTKIVLEHKGSLQVIIDMAVYPNYCAYEWTVYFKNISDKRIAAISNINAVDMELEGNQPVLKGVYGDGKVIDSKSALYSPYEINMEIEPKKQFKNTTGRPCELDFPYYNLQYGNGGAFIAIGWPGSWMSEFEYKENNVLLKAGQQYFNANLEPGETVRTPLMAFLFYEGRDAKIATNLWRHWFIDCNMRKVEGELFPPQTAAYTGGFTAEMVNTNEEQQMELLQIYLDNDIPLDYWWMDAGWYFKTGDKSLTTWLDSGNLKVDTKRFPTEFAAISELAAKNDMKTMLWFEPEVVRLPNSLLDNDGIKPEWIIGQDGTWRIADYGNPAYADWLVERVSSILDKGGISLYRQDFGNIPISLWLGNDGENRTGMTENLYVQGYLSYWDRLIERFPNMMIDSCASGGNKNDLESMRRAVSLHKTDYSYEDYDMKQSMHQSLFQWFPYFGTMTTAGGEVSSYALRSHYCPWFASSFDIRRDNFKWDTFRNGYDELNKLQMYYYADYYPLTEWDYNNKDWRGWQFFDPERQSGFIQLFCQKGCETVGYSAKLYGLEENSQYRLTDIDGVYSRTASGKELMQDGLTVLVDKSRIAFVFLIEKVSS